MRGLQYNFEEQDLVIKPNGTFSTAITDNQTCALITLSQVCRITMPEIGEQIGAKLINRKTRSVASILSAAERAVESDGATQVAITLDDNSNLQFKANYGN